MAHVGALKPNQNALSVHSLLQIETVSTLCLDAG